jgi:hypothetical protein
MEISSKINNSMTFKLPPLIHFYYFKEKAALFILKPIFNMGLGVGVQRERKIIVVFVVNR